MYILLISIICPKTFCNQNFYENFYHNINQIDYFWQKVGVA